MRKILNKKGKAIGSGMVVVIVALSVIIALGLGYFMFGTKGTGVAGNVVNPLPGPQEQTAGVCQQACPTSLAWAGTVNMQNLLNTTAVENYDTTTYFYEKNADGTRGALKTSITDTTSGGVTLTCGKTYTAETLSTGGEAGDSARLLTSDLGTVDNNGIVTLTACGDGQTFTIGSNQRGLPEARAFDVINNGFSFDAIGNVASGYSSSQNVTFDSSTNQTNVSVATGGEVHQILYVRANGTDTNFNDEGVYVLVDANTNRWIVPTVKIDGAVATDVKAQLNDDEKKAYSQYEYVYLIPNTRQITKSKEVAIDFSEFALGGVNPVPADSPIIALSPRGKYLSTMTANTLKIGAVDDSSTQVPVYITNYYTLGVA